jgi:hypothetical protein
MHMRTTRRARPRGALRALLGAPEGRRVSDGQPTIVGISLRAVLGDQLAFETHPDAPPGETQTDLGDLDMARADRRRDAAEERLLAAIAAAAKPRPCRCHPGPMVLDEDDLDEARCSRCGREAAS